MKTPKLFLRYAAMLLAVLLLAAVLALQLPSVQTALARKALTAVEGRIDAKIVFGKLWLKPFNTLVIKDFLLQDPAPAHPGQTDTLMYAGAVYVQFSLKGLTGGLREGIYLKSATFKDAMLNLVREDNDYYRTNMRRMFRVPPTVAEDKPDKNLVGVANVKFRNFRFRTTNLAEPSTAAVQGSADWKKLEMGHADLDAEDFLIRGSVFSFTVNKLSFLETSGWEVKRLSMRARIGRGLCRMDDIRLEDCFGSTADIDYRMTGRKPQYLNFADSVHLDVNFKDSRLNIETLAHLIPALNKSRGMFLKVQGKVQGYISDWHTEGLLLDIEDKGFSTTLRGGARNVTKPEKMKLDLDLVNTSITTSDIPSLLSAVKPGLKLDLGTIGKAQRYLTDISAEGNMQDLRLKLSLKQGSDGGELFLDTRVCNLAQKPAFKGKLSTERLDIQRLLGSGKLGRLSIDTDFEISLRDKALKTRKNRRAGLIPDIPLDAELQKLKIDCLAFNAYEYSSLEGAASLRDGAVDVQLYSRDKSLDADLLLKGDLSKCQAMVNVRKIDLYATNFDKRGPAIAGVQITANCDNSLEPLRGIVGINNIVVSTAGESFTVPDLTFAADCAGGRRKFMLSSQAIDADYNADGRSFSLSFASKNIQPLLSYLLPGAYVEKGGSLNLAMDSLGVVRGNACCGRIAYGNNFLKDLTLDIGGNKDSISAGIAGTCLQIMGIPMANASLECRLDGQKAGLDFSFDNDSESGLRNGRLSTVLALKNRKPSGIKFLPSQILIEDRLWRIAESDINFSPESITVKGFHAQSDGGGESYLTMDGEYPGHGGEPLRISAKNLHLDILNSLVNKSGFSFGGTVSAEGSVTADPDGTLQGFDLALSTDSLQFCGSRLGEIDALCRTDRETEGLRLEMADRIDDRDALQINALYNPKNKTAQAAVTMDRFPFGFLQVPMARILPELDGSISGTISADGPIQNLNIGSDSLRLNGAMARLGITGARYYLDGGLELNGDGVALDSLKGHDRFDNPFSVRGGIKWKSLKDMAFDLHLSFDNLEAANMLPKEATVFHGQLFAQGEVGLTGPAKSMQLSVNCKTLPGSDIFVVSNGMASASKSELLEFTVPFKKELDAYEVMMAERQKNTNSHKSGNMTMLLNIDATPSLNIGMDVTFGGLKYAMTASGEGPLEMTIKPSEKVFNIVGDYTISEGSFGVNVSDLIRRDLTITSGSHVKFGGNLEESTLNLEARYVTKASIATLIADTSSVSNRRTVECLIGLKDKLTKPDISFGINIPDLEPSVQSRVESALSSEDKVQKQVLALLLSNSFVPDEQSGIVNANSLLYSNVSDIMANQVNQIFNRLNIPLDLGLNYQPGTNGGTNIFDVAISTQLFNNRVIIGGTFGNKQNTTSSTQTFFGDVDVQIKLDRRGEFRLNLFSHSADQYTNSLDNSQRNGIGFTWQNEFDQLGRFVRTMFLPKKKKEEAAAKEALETKKTRIITLDE